ncbi:MAG: hypothetical protein JW745_09250 [Sedimentisphaerales bacterium]|nr:hypothetical protein [Sedimentisphaerales bacterium]MBN2842351.1 hypothetical protein [Sedimentisphaerales bacterium]
MSEILITGFMPFGNFTENPSGMLATEYGEKYAGLVTGKGLPVEYELARQELVQLLDTIKPQACICIGLAAGDTFRLETLARKPQQYEQYPGQEIYHSIIPDNISQYCTEHEHFIISENCGQYVCEATLWTLLDHAARHNNPQTAFFLHVPAISTNWPYSRIKDIFAKFFDLCLTILLFNYGGMSENNFIFR